MASEFFICYPSPNRDAANALSWFLQDRKRLVVLDTEAIALGEAWDAKLSTELEQASVAVVLVSSNSAQAYYQREEISRAIRLARKASDRRHVVPVMLPGATEADLPYGLSIVQGLDASKSGGLERIAQILDEKFPKREVSAPILRRDQVLGAALRLDRVKAWADIATASLVADNSLFLFHGRRNQAVGLFQERIQRFFAEEVNAPQLVCRAPFKIDGQAPRAGVDWLAHLRDALACTGSLAPEIARLVQQQPLFVMLGELPLPLDRLSEEHFAALGDFLTEHLPALLKQAGVQRRMTVMMVFDYLEKPIARLERLGELGRKAAATGWLRFRPLPEASLPTWGEVKDYLEDYLQPRPTPAVITNFEQVYMKLIVDPNLAFEELAREIDSWTLAG
jgi:hypothetical protein